MHRRVFLATAALATAGCVDTTSDEDGAETAEGPLPFGDSYTTDDEIVVTVRRLELQQSFTYTHYSGREREKPSTDDAKYAFLYVAVEHDGDSMEFAPWGSEFVLETPEQTYQQRYLDRSEGEYSGGEIAPGARRSGWISYVVTDGLEEADVTVALYGESGGGLTAKWDASE